MEKFDPASAFIWFISSLVPVMFLRDPVILCIALVASVIFYSLVGKRRKNYHLIVFFVFFLSAVLNPIFSHNGRTVLFVANNNPITMESVIYGLVCAVMIAGVMYISASFSAIMTADRLGRVFGILSPKLALVFSMSLREIPLFSAQMRKVRAQNRCAGLYKDENIVDRVRGEVKVFSAVVTWALENGITTAESMEARGYGKCRRTSFSLYKIHARDIAFMIFSALSAALLMLADHVGLIGAQYYPSFEAVSGGILKYGVYLVSICLYLSPTVICLTEGLREKIKLDRCFGKNPRGEERV